MGHDGELADDFAWVDSCHGPGSHEPGKRSVASLSLTNMIRTSSNATITFCVLHSPSALKFLRPFPLAKTRHLDSGTLVSNSYRLSRPVSSMAHMNRTQKEEGDISSVFASLDESRSASLPDRFIELKKALWKDSFTNTWKEVLSALESATEEISELGSKVNSPYSAPPSFSWTGHVKIVPRIPYSEVRDRKVTDEQILEVKKRGCVVITGGIPPEVLASASYPSLSG
jgi:hypothetical protein